MRHPGRSRRRTMSMRRGIPSAVLAVIVLTGCSTGEGGVGGAAKNKGVAADGVSRLVPEDRGKPLEVTGTLLTGQSWSTADAKSKVVVLNVWGSWCGPCQGEFPQLQKAWTQLQAANAPVVLMGVDYKESSANALATVKERGLTYSSLRAEDGHAIATLGSAFKGTPTTLVLDTQHRIAAVVPGPITTDTLLSLVADTRAGH